MQSTILLSMVISLIIISETEAFLGYGLGIDYRLFGVAGWGLIGLGIGYRIPVYVPYLGFFNGKRDVSKIKPIECIYFSVANMIKCNRGAVECESIQNLDDLKFDIFGIEFVNSNSLRLYAKNFTENTFADYQVSTMDGNSKINLTLFQNGVQGKGIMFKDTGCFKKFADLFKTIQSPVLVETTLNTKVTISGFVFKI